MGDANGRLDLIHILAAGSAGPKGIDPEIFVVDDEVDIIIQFGIDEDRGKGSMPALVGIEGGDAHEPVYAGFSLEIPVGIGPCHGQRHALDAGLFSREQIQRFDLEFLAFGPPHIHAKQHLRPILRLRSAGAGMDRQNRIVGVQFAREQQFEP